VQRSQAHLMMIASMRKSSSSLAQLCIGRVYTWT